MEPSPAVIRRTRITLTTEAVFYGLAGTFLGGIFGASLFTAIAIVMILAGLCIGCRFMDLKMKAETHVLAEKMISDEITALLHQLNWRWPFTFFAGMAALILTVLNVTYRLADYQQPFSWPLMAVSGFMAIMVSFTMNEVSTAMTCHYLSLKAGKVNDANQTA